MADDFLEQSYYPSARIRLILRFDSIDRPRYSGKVPPNTPISGLKGKGKPPLEIKEENGTLVLVKPGQAIQFAAPQQRGVSDDLDIQVIEGVIPVRATLSYNGIRTASTFSAEIQYQDMPIDPRMLRGIGVEYYLGTVTADEFQRGIAGETRDGEGNTSEPLNIIPTEYIDGYGRKRTNLRFRGWIDDYEVSWFEGMSMIKINCRDNSTLLIDTECPPQLTINPKKPIDRSFAEYLAFFPQFVGLRVEYRPKGSEIPIYEKVLQKTAFKPILGPASSGGSVWDYFTDMCGAIGHTCRFEPEGATIIIQRSRAIYGNRFYQRSDDPFQGRTLPSGRVLPFRLFVYGRNLSSYTVKRKYTVAGPTTIEVRCYSTTLKKTLVVRYPLGKDRLPRGLPTGILPDEKIKVYNVQGIKDEASLRVTAQEIYEQLGRNEIEVSLKTSDLGSFGGSALDPDMLDCKAGDTIQIEVASDRETANLNTNSDVEVRKLIASRAADYIKSLGFGNEFAKAYGKAVAKRATQSLFRLRRVEFSWDVEKGIDIALDAINYLEVRGDKLPAGEEPDFQESPEEARDRVIRQARQFGIVSLLKQQKLAC